MDYKPQFPGAPKMLITNEGQAETHQQIESVINMFPQPTAEQMDEFNELQQISHSQLSNNLNTLTPDQPVNLRVGLEKFEKKEDAFMRNSQQHNQIASQQIKQEHSPAKGEEDRRVRTTNPGSRARPNKQN